MGTDATRTARSALLIGDFGGVFLQLRRADEMQTLAACFGLVPGEADRWLAGGPVRQVELRRRIEAANPELAPLLRTSYDLLSNEAHGRAQALAAYENRSGAFDWPPHADAIDHSRIRSSFVTTLAVLLAHFGTVRWMVRGWESLPVSLGAATTAYYDALVTFVLNNKEHGIWQAIAPGHAADWLTAVAATTDE